MCDENMNTWPYATKTIYYGIFIKVNFTIIIMPNFT